ncbi:MAG: SpoIID/LytB domain-containing protein, partial [Lachnospiraceae bacterium]|nr:SpoIID/LytB domain-containing protein [Lachnospiraceae bacterium]
GYKQLAGSGYSQYGAHVDDSVNYQVYNKQEPSEQALQAADATKGEVLSFQGEIIETYYYSTSFGHTGDYQAWNLEPDAYGYLVGDWLRSTPAEVDLSDEASFAAYIQQPDPECYEQNIRYFRWNTVLHPKDVQDQLLQTIRSRKKIQPDAIHYYSKDLTQELDSPSGMGTLENIAVGARNASGVILELQMWYENGMVQVTSEYNIRAILGTAASDVNYQDGSSGSVTLLPSAYISITKLEDGNYQVYGGGYGHGIGMSQNGANQLAGQGWKYRDILNFFYRGTEITSCLLE